MIPRTHRRTLVIAVSVLALTGCKDLKIRTQDNKDEFRFASNVHLWLTYKDEAIPADAQVTLNWSSDRDGALGSGHELTVDTLSAGKHKITVSGRYKDKDFKCKKKIEIKNDKPEPQISEPAGRTSYALGSPVRLAGAARDREDGSVPGESLAWSSSIDGELGSGAIVFANRLTPGTHTITLKARDAAGATAKDTVTVEIINKAPVPTISAPSSNATIGVGASITFRGSAVDPDPMNGTPAIPVDSLAWHSNRDGRLGTGAELTTNRLSPGEHRIELRASDEFGAVGKASVKVEVINRAPVVDIRSPGSDSFTVADRIRFKVRVSDPDGFDIDEDDVVWKSNRDGKIGEGLEFRTQTLTPGRHEITVEATDRHGATSKDSVRIRVTNEAPTARITRPTDAESTVYWADEIRFEGQGTDPEDGNVDGDDYEWIAINEDTGRRKNLGDGRRRTVEGEDLGFGRHRVELRVKDQDGAESEAVSVRVTVPNREPSVSIATPSTDETFTAGTQIRFTGSALDLDRDRWAKDGELAWTAQLVGGATFALGTGRELEANNLQPGRYRIVLTATDPDDDRITSTDAVFVVIHPAPSTSAGAGSGSPAATTSSSTGTTGATGALDSVGNN
jgi:hypothetical protein